MSHPLPRLVVVGAGGFGRLWLPALRNCGLLPVAIVDRLHENAQDFANELGLRPRDVVCDFDEALRRGADLVLDSAPPAERGARVTRAIEEGLDVLAVKPLVWSAEDARRIEQTAARCGRRVFVAMQKRYLPAFQALRRALPTLGTVGYVGIDLQVDGRVWQPGMTWRKHLRFPSLYEGAIHHLDLLTWLLDLRVLRVTASAWNPPWSEFQHADFCALLRCEGPVTVHYLSRWATRSEPISHYFSGLRIEASGGSASVHQGALRIDGKPLPELESADPRMDLERLNEDLLRDVLRSLSGASGDPSLEVAFHRRVLELTDAIAAALEKDEVSAA